MSFLDTYWAEVKGNVYAIVPCGIAVWVWVRVKHKALMEAHQEHSKGLEHLLKALDPDEETDNMLDRIADRVDENTPGGIRAVLDAVEHPFPQPKPPSKHSGKAVE